MSRLATLIREITSESSVSEIAVLIGKSKSYVSQVRTSRQVPTDLALAVMAAGYAPEALPELVALAARERARSQRLPDDAMREKALAMLELLTIESSRAEKASAPTHGSRSFRNFPQAFYPLAIVTGDKREERGRHISVADFGSLAATPADTRWIVNLGLRRDVIKHIDKNFILLPEERLIERFAEVNLLVIGSPAANHLARLINRTSVFRFNCSVAMDCAVDQIIAKAREYTPAGLVAYQEECRLTLAEIMLSFFTGGIIDPTYPSDYLRASHVDRISGARTPGFDYGLLSFAANPFYEAKCRAEGRRNDHRYISILAAGIHHPATAHTVRLLGEDMRARGIFDDHPLGGVVRVSLDPNLAFSERVEAAECEWVESTLDSPQTARHARNSIVRELNGIVKRKRRGELQKLELTLDQVQDCIALVESLVT